MHFPKMKQIMCNVYSTLYSSQSNILHHENSMLIDSFCWTMKFHQSERYCGLCVLILWMHLIAWLHWNFQINSILCGKSSFEIRGKWKYKKSSQQHWRDREGGWQSVQTLNTSLFSTYSNAFKIIERNLYMNNKIENLHTKCIQM